MAIARIDFRQYMQPGAATINDRVNDHLLNQLSAAEAKDISFSAGAMEKADGYMRLAGISPTGYAIQFDGTAAEGVSFPDHADYDLGQRWTIDVTYKATTVPASGTEPIYWRADDSNNKITALEINDDGAFVFTHRDSNGTETTLTSPHTISDGETAQIRVQRFGVELRMFVDRRQSAVRADLDTSYDTASADNKWYVGVGTATDGDTVTAVDTCVGLVDEFRVFRDEIRDGNIWAYTEYPALGDERLVLYARFNESSGSVIDHSLNQNHGTVIGSAARNASSLVVEIAPVFKLHHFRASDGTEQWCLWSNGAFYAVGVQ